MRERHLYQEDPNLLKRSTRTAMLLGLCALLIMPVLAGCHDNQSDFANMSKDQQVKAATTSTPAMQAAANAARAKAMGAVPAPGSTAPTSAKK